MRYAMQEADSTDGRLFECAEFSQRLRPVAGEQLDDRCDEVLYVLSGSGSATIEGHAHDLQPGTAVFVARGTPWSAAGDAQAVSVLVHDPAPGTAAHAVVDLTAVERGEATGGRTFLLGVTPDVGCESVTQFIGLVPPGRAPDHFHRDDEVVYVLAGEGAFHVDGESAMLRPGSCVHLPARLVHCLENQGPGEMRVLGVFRPAGSPAEAYYPDGSAAVVPAV
jgi:mannose-6-phosphate isomerase-like protein (cupin superfamily)